MEEGKQTVYRIKDLEDSERPRERLAAIGPQALSNAELLAILLRVGIKGENAVQMGQRLLMEFGGLRGLHRASFEDICNTHGLGPAKGAQIKAAIELGNRLRLETLDDKPVIQGPEDVYSLVQYEMSAMVQENLWVLNLDTRNKVLNITRLYKGSLNASTVRVGELFKAAISQNAASIILLHNHPSGDPKPSPEDVQLTRAVVQAGTILDIELLDHVIIGLGSYVSLKEKGFGFKS